MSDERSRLSADQRARASAALAALLAGLPEWRAAAQSGGCIAGFAATRGELDPGPSLAQAREGGARLAWPRVDGEGAGRVATALAAAAADDKNDQNGEGGNGGPLETARGEGRPEPRLRFHLADTAQLRRGRFGIAEPEHVSPEVAARLVDVMLVPGLAFDACGNRLGFGGGYYDEVLLAAPGLRPGLVVGLGYDFQLVEQCPADELDARVDCVVTDARVIRCQAPGPLRDRRKVGP